MGEFAHPFFCKYFQMKDPLAQIYKSVQANSILLNEGVEGEELPKVDDGVIQNFIPDELVKNLISGSGRYSDSGGAYRGEYELSFPLSKWSDGTEDLEDTYDYIEHEISSSLPNVARGPGGDYIQSQAVVKQEQSDNENIVLRCVFSGGLDV
jgi:hypothetical protein